LSYDLYNVKNVGNSIPLNSNQNRYTNILPVIKELENVPSNMENRNSNNTGTAAFNFLDNLTNSSLNNYLQDVGQE
jgi:hypothetical protein